MILDAVRAGDGAGAARRSGEHLAGAHEGVIPGFRPGVGRPFLIPILPLPGGGAGEPGSERPSPVSPGS
jgi:hypothetical protein